MRFVLSIGHQRVFKNIWLAVRGNIDRWRLNDRMMTLNKIINEKLARVLVFAYQETRNVS